jgi:hypothetical protein
MRADRLARLRLIASSGAQTSFAGGVTVTPAVTPKKPGVAPVTPVTPLVRGKGKGDQASVEILDSAGPDVADIDERAGIASDSVPSRYLYTWARLNCQKPAGVSEAEWRLALDDGGRFLDAWGNEAANLGWTPGEFFDVTGGLVWRLGGERVEVLGPDHARLADGRTVIRGTSASETRTPAPRSEPSMQKEGG